MCSRGPLEFGVFHNPSSQVVEGQNGRKKLKKRKKASGQRKPTRQTSEGVWSPFYVESAGIFAPKGLDSKAQGDSPRESVTFYAVKAQRAATRRRSEWQPVGP